MTVARGRGAVRVARDRGCAILPLVAAAIVAAWDLDLRDRLRRAATSSRRSTRCAFRGRPPARASPRPGSSATRRRWSRCVGRALVVAIGVLALVGAVRELRRAAAAPRRGRARRSRRSRCSRSGDYDGEILFRIYLFASPFLAFFAAHAFLASRRGAAAARRSAVAYAAAGAVLLGAVPLRLLRQGPPVLLHAGRGRRGGLPLRRTRPPGSLLDRGHAQLPRPVQELRALHLRAALARAGVRARALRRPARAGLLRVDERPPLPRRRTSSSRAARRRRSRRPGRCRRGRWTASSAR